MATHRQPLPSLGRQDRGEGFLEYSLEELGRVVTGVLDRNLDL